MKKLFISSIILSSLVFCSCEKYLDKAPESAFTQEEVFSKLENFRKFFDGVYSGITDGVDYNYLQGSALYFSMWDRKFSWEALTDFSDAGRMRENQIIKRGLMGSLVDYFTYTRAIGSVTGNQRPILGGSYSTIRRANTALQNIDLLNDASQEDIDDLKGQAYFIRAFMHFTLFKVWGRQAYLTKPLGPDDQWDIPRLSNYETLMHIAADLDTALTYFESANKMRRDNPLSGGAGHLNSPEQHKPTGVAAKGLKSRVLLYAASPLNNEKGKTDWEAAAKESWEAIKLAEQYGYFLLTADNYKQNFVGVNYSDEQLWAWAAGAQSYSAGRMRGLINGIFGASQTVSSGECPSQNAVDMFETKWGDPLNTDSDRQSAIALNHYTEQNPYADRDPRFYVNIIYNEAPIPGYTTAKIYYEVLPSGAVQYSELLNQGYAGITRTGYYQNKFWGGQSTKNRTQPLLSDPLIRLAELYLNYAEAANEAYGPNTVPAYATMSSVQAINHIRARIGMPDVSSAYTADADKFRPRIKNERNVELAFEGHYYNDIRRWLDVATAMTGPMIGMDIEKVPQSVEYPRGYKYTRKSLPAERQVFWKPEMMFFPFGTTDNYKLKNFEPNPLW